MKQQKEKTALDLARALKRYNNMTDPAEAYTALHDEWPQQITKMIDPIFWSEIKQRSKKQIVADLDALQKAQAAKSARVQAFINKGLSAQKAVDKVMADEKRRAKKAGTRRKAA